MHDHTALDRLVGKARRVDAVDENELAGAGEIETGDCLRGAADRSRIGRAGRRRDGSEQRTQIAVFIIFAAPRRQTAPSEIVERALTRFSNTAEAGQSVAHRGEVAAERIADRGLGES